MAHYAGWTRAIGAVAALLICPVLLIFGVPFMVGIARDMVGAAGILPVLATFGCAGALAAALSPRMRSR